MLNNNGNEKELEKIKVTVLPPVERKRPGQRIIPRPLTKWEAGQVIISVYDKIRESVEELKENGYLDLAAQMSKSADAMADLLDSHGSHDFGLGRSKEIAKTEVELIEQWNEKVLGAGAQEDRQEDRRSHLSRMEP